MILAFWCVLIAGLMPIGCAYLAKFGGRDEPSPVAYDNRAPRAWLAQQTGKRARANAAQSNSLEAFPLFAIGVVVAVLQHVPVATIDALAVVFVAARVAYVACYVGDRPTLRSTTFAIGFLASIGLYVVAATGTLR